MFLQNRPFRERKYLHTGRHACFKLQTPAGLCRDKNTKWKKEICLTKAQLNSFHLTQMCCKSRLLFISSQKRVPWRSIDSKRLPVDCDQWKWYISRHFKPQNAATLQPVDSNDGVCLSSIPFHHHHRFTRQWNDYLLVRERQNHPPNLQLPHHKLGDRWLDHVPSLHASSLYLPCSRQVWADQRHADVRDKSFLIYAEYLHDVLLVPVTRVPSQRCHATTPATKAKPGPSTLGGLHVLAFKRVCRCCVDPNGATWIFKRRRLHPEAVSLLVDQPKSWSLRGSFPPLFRFSVWSLHSCHSRVVLHHILEAWHPFRGR